MAWKKADTAVPRVTMVGVPSIVTKRPTPPTQAEIDKKKKERVIDYLYLRLGTGLFLRLHLSPTTAQVSSKAPASPTNPQKTTAKH